MPKVSSDSVVKTPQRARPYNISKSTKPVPSPTSSPSQRPRVNKIHTCLICKGSIKEGKKLNLVDKLTELMYHYAACFYDKHKFKDIIDAGPDNRDDNGDPIEEFGTRFKYKCPYPDCANNSGKRPARLVGFKEYCIHLAVVHFHLETALEQDDTEGMEEVLKAVRDHRMKQNLELEEIPPVEYEEIHCCLLCKGATGKDAKNLSLKKEKLNSLKYHYADCYYDTGVYLERYPPGEENMDQETGQPLDVLGKTIKYNCDVPGCKNKRLMGYKSWCIHMAVDHGGLFEIMREDSNPEIRNLVERLESMQ